jgi:hypothetical protein
MAQFICKGCEAQCVLFTRTPDTDKIPEFNKNFCFWMEHARPGKWGEWK